MADPITEEDLKAVIEDKPEGFVCPECGEVFPRPGQLGLHRFHKHGVKGSGSAPKKSAYKRTRPPARTRTPGTPKVSSGEAAVKEAVDEAVGNLIVIGGYLAIVLPHTGLAISGDPGGNGRLPVQSRAVVAGDILAEYAKRDARVLEAIQRFNLFFKGSAAAKLAVDMAAVVAVDVGVIDPHMEMEVGPFREGTVFGPLKPVEMIVGDVVAAVDNLREQYAPSGAAATADGGIPAPASSTNGAAPATSRRRRTAAQTTVIDGGVEAT